MRWIVLLALWASAALAQPLEIVPVGETAGVVRYGAYSALQ